MHNVSSFLKPIIMDSDKEFYDSWATQQMNDKNRSLILKWKAINFLNLLLRNGLTQFKRICEIGGAEGILLDTLDKVISVESLFNYDISTPFCKAGEKAFPNIVYKNCRFDEDPQFFDLILLSDITEHVDSDHKLLNEVKDHCTYLLIKMPIEKALFSSPFFYSILFRKFPDNLRYGKTHINGHLRGYTVHSAKELISKYFHIINEEISDVAYFNPSPKKKLIKKVLGNFLFIRIYGGAYFALCKSKKTVAK